MTGQHDTAHLLLQVVSRRFVEGCWAGADEPTAVVEVSLSGQAILDGLAEARLRARAPGLCAEESLFGVTDSDWPGAFLTNATEGEGPAHAVGAWVVALTVAIQRWGRDPVWRGRVVSADPHRLVLAIPWRRQQFFDEALNLALRLLPAWLRQQPTGVPPGLLRWFDPVAVEAPETVRAHFGERWEVIQRNGLSPFTLRIIQAGIARDMPFEVMPSWVQVGWGANADRFDMMFSGESSWIATLLAKNKVKTSRTLAGAGIPVPKLMLVADLQGAQEAARRLGWPVVVKPVNQDQGIGVTALIEDTETLRTAVETAARLSPREIIVERHIEGDDYRLLVVHGQTLMVVRRTPAGVVGDGVHTVSELVRAANAHPWRGTNAFSRLKLLVLDDPARSCLRQQGLDPEAVPESGRSVWLRRIANLSAGGTAIDVTAQTHPDNRALAERAARIVGLDIAGIDLLIPDITRSWRDVGGAVCEVNAQPGFRVHWLADEHRDLEGEILEMLFAGRDPRIPTAAVVGDATAVDVADAAELLHRIWCEAGTIAGVATRRGVRVGDDVVSATGVSTLAPMRALLVDPSVQAAVFELPVSTLQRFGHPCDRYDVVGVLDGNGVLPAEAVQRADKAVVLNAEDPHFPELAANTTAPRVIAVGDATHPAIVRHRAGGGESVSVDAAGRITATTRHGEVVLGPRAAGPAALLAAAMAWAQGVPAPAGADLMDIAVQRR